LANLISRLFSEGLFVGRKGLTTQKMGLKRQLLRLSLFVGLIGAVVLGLGNMFKERFIFYPVKGLEHSILKTGWPNAEEVWLEGLKGRFYAWWAPSEVERPVVLLLHGNGGNLTDMIGRIMTYHWLKIGVLAIDYEGYGLSEGKPSLEAAVFDAVAAWDYLVDVKKVNPKNIIVHGYSLGGGIAGQLLKARPISHPVVFESTFTSLTAAAESSLPSLGPLPKLFLGGAYDTQKVLASYKATIAIFAHSPEDEVVAYKLGQALYESYHNGPKIMVEFTGGHLNYLLNQGRLERALIDGLKLTFPKVPATPEPQADF
jgi:pimeloyl-ACP methyl ester carboxylesterase